MKPPLAIMATTLLLCLPLAGQAQDFSLRREHDSLYWLNEWRLPHPVYQFQTGDVDGDGHPDALVGVVKATRFHPDRARRLQVYRLYKGRVRPLWLGSRLGGPLEDFRFVDGRVRTLEQSGPDRYAVADYRWQGFGFERERCLLADATRSQALAAFSPDKE